jgi:beta-phosphoglucomutase-like phosphatase (HAD superfamily)
MSLLAAKKLGVLPEETVMVVDTINDIISGNAAEMKTIAVNRHNSKQLGSHLLNDVNPNVTIDDLSTLAEIISQL